MLFKTGLDGDITPPLPHIYQGGLNNEPPPSLFALLVSPCPVLNGTLVGMINPPLEFVTYIGDPSYWKYTYDCKPWELFVQGLCDYIFEYPKPYVYLVYETYYEKPISVNMAAKVSY